jgi:hypothetical protein
VWHCPVRAAPEDRLLSDQEWAQVARDVMHRTGLSPHGQDDDAVRWIAVRHGPDHIHIVAMLARQDRQRVSTFNDRYRVRDACLAAERRYGLRSTAPADRTADRHPTRAEREKAARNGRTEPPRLTLRRQVATAAASAGSIEDFLARLDPAKIGVRLRYSAKNPEQVTGYAVSLPGDSTTDGAPVWYGGGKLATDLSWTGLQRRWEGPRDPGPRWTPQERDDLWRHAAAITDTAAAQIRDAASPEAAADAAYAAGDALRVTAAALGSPVLAQAADAYDRAARQQHGRIPPPTPAGNQLRHAARVISAYAYLTGTRSLAPLVLLIRLAALAETLTGLRNTQQSHWQAGAALRAARHLHQAASTTGPGQRPGPVPHVPGTTRPAATPAADTIAVNFPSSPFEPGRPPSPGQPGTGTPPPRRRPEPPRPRGPTR